MCVSSQMCIGAPTHTHTKKKKHPLAKKEGEDTNVGTHVRYGCSLLQCKFEKHEQRDDDSFEATKYIL